MHVSHRAASPSSTLMQPVIFSPSDQHCLFLHRARFLSPISRSFSLSRSFLSLLGTATWSPTEVAGVRDCLSRPAVSKAHKRPSVESGQPVCPPAAAETRLALVLHTSLSRSLSLSFLRSLVLFSFRLSFSDFSFAPSGPANPVVSSRCSLHRGCLNVTPG